MSIKPILFNTEMVRAILDGRKTQTRRIVKGLDGLNVYRAEPSEEAYETLDEWDFFYGGSLVGGGMFDAIQSVKAPCAVGDVLYVRETWCKGRVECGEEPDGRNVLYIGQCTGDDSFIPKEWAFRHDVETEDVVWRPSIHMPREAARIFLRVTDVRVERLWDMDEEAAIAEGFEDSPSGTDSPLERFSVLWDKTIKRDDLREFGYHANPWVWVIEFERCEKPTDEERAAAKWE